MRIGIIGTGNVGRAIARGLNGKGHDVVLGTREPAQVDAFASECGARCLGQVEAAAVSEVVILALPWGAAEVAVRGLGDLTGKIVIDCMNPLAMVNGVFGLTLGHTTSGGEVLASWVPGARVVKTLNQVGAEMMAQNGDLPHRPVMFMAGNDLAAKEAVAAILFDLGFEPEDAGDLTKSRLLEPLAMVWINQALARGKGRDWALAAIQRKGATA